MRCCTGAAAVKRFAAVEASQLGVPRRAPPQAKPPTPLPLSKTRETTGEAAARAPGQLHRSKLRHHVVEATGGGNDTPITQRHVTVQLPPLRSSSAVHRRSSHSQRGYHVMCFLGIKNASLLRDALSACLSFLFTPKELLQYEVHVVYTLPEAHPLPPPLVEPPPVHHLLRYTGKEVCATSMNLPWSVGREQCGGPCCADERLSRQPPRQAGLAGGLLGILRIPQEFSRKAPQGTDPRRREQSMVP